MKEYLFVNVIRWLIWIMIMNMSIYRLHQLQVLFIVQTTNVDAWPKPDLPTDASSAPWSSLLKCWHSVYISVHFLLLFLGIIIPALLFVDKIMTLSFVETHLCLWLVSAKPFTKVWDWPPQANKWRAFHYQWFLYNSNSKATWYRSRQLKDKKDIWYHKRWKICCRT